MKKWGCFSGHVTLPQGTPTIGLEVRLMNGVPCLFTERGEFVRGQQNITLRAGLDDATKVAAEILVEREDNADDAALDRARELSRLGRL